MAISTKSVQISMLLIDRLINMEAASPEYRTKKLIIADHVHTVRLAFLPLLIISIITKLIVKIGRDIARLRRQIITTGIVDNKSGEKTNIYNIPGAKVARNVKKMNIFSPAVRVRA